MRVCDKAQFVELMQMVIEGVGNIVKSGLPGSQAVLSAVRFIASADVAADRVGGSSFEG